MELTNGKGTDYHNFYKEIEPKLKKKKIKGKKCASKKKSEKKKKK